MTRTLFFALPLLLAGCPDSHPAAGDDGGVLPDGSSIVHDCYGMPDPGLACDFTEPCERISDFWMGYCGTETWSCVDGRVAYDDARFGCSLDAGVPDGGRTWCAEYDGPPTATSGDCRTNDDCAASGGYCVAPGDTSGNHATGFCPMECSADADCADGSVCELLNGGSCSRCTPACTPASCGYGETCGDDGHCAAASCLTGDYTCPPGSSCGLTGTPADLHGCALVACASDADCGCGACVLGACALGPGRCDLPRP